MPLATVHSHSKSKRCFFSKTMAYGLSACTPIELFAKQDAGNRTAINIKPWTQLDMTSVGTHGGSESAEPFRDFTLWPDSSPTLRLTHWTQTTLRLIVKYQQNPLRAARVLAYLHVGMHDAWHYALSAGHANTSPASAKKEAEKAAHETACGILTHFYPNETPGTFSAMLAAMTVHLTRGSDEGNKAAISIAVTTRLIDRSLRDGAGRAWPIKLRPADFPGIWQASYPLYAVNPTEGFAGNWLPWVTPSASRYVPPTAPRPGSSHHTFETEEVLKTFATLTETQTRGAQKWHLEAGSVTPAGVWVEIALDDLIKNKRTSSQGSEENTLFALQTLSMMCVAMHDAFIACWKIKFRDWSERPITAIRRSIDSKFVPLLVTPGFPSYVSGHATISAAAAHVLGLQWPGQKMQFEAMAQEAADSRLWGGIHFKSDNEEGLKLGLAVGKDIAIDRNLDTSVF